MLKLFGFNKEVENVEKGSCPFCSKQIDPETEYRDELSKKEYGISGMCQKCQDRIFGERKVVKR